MEPSFLHTFVLCAYGESPFLEECVASLLAQTVPSRIVMATSTPNSTVEAIAARYSIPLFVNQGEAGITGDWNFGMSLADTPYITIAHQDDVYTPGYTESVLKKAEKSKHPILIFSEYFEIRNGERIDGNSLLHIKRMLNSGFRLFPHSRWVRLRILSLGNSICCPAVTYCRSACSDFQFDRAYQFACDWDAWDRLARRKGDFLYISSPLMGHRIHEGSETTKLTANDRRKEEELSMFRRYWPEFIARFLSRRYAKGADSNQL